MRFKITCGIAAFLVGMMIAGLLSEIVASGVLIAGSASLLPVLLILLWALSGKQSQSEKVIADTGIELAIATERERIYRNLHDDVGAQLLNLVYGAPDAETAQAARRVLDELRVAIARTIDRALTIAELLGDMRAELEERLEAAGVSLLWDCEIEGGEQRLPPKTAIALSRVVRELVSNLIKHAGATHCRMQIAQHSAKFSLCVGDDGAGMARTGSAGRGMDSIRKRVSELNGEVRWEPAPDGGTLAIVEIEL